jgi:hypothetical protein
LHANAAVARNPSAIPTSTAAMSVRICSLLSPGGVDRCTGQPFTGGFATLEEIPVALLYVREEFSRIRNKKGSAA